MRPSQTRVLLIAGILVSILTGLLFALSGSQHAHGPGTREVDTDDSARGNTRPLNARTTTSSLRQQIPGVEAVSGSLWWEFDSAIADAPFCVLPETERSVRTIREAIGATVARTGQDGSWTVRRVDVGRRVWFGIAPHIFVSERVTASGADIRIPRCAIKASIWGLGDGRCFLSALPYAQLDGENWSLEEHAFITHPERAGRVSLLTQFNGERTNDGVIDIPTLPGARYQIDCASRHAVSDKSSHTATAPCTVHIRFAQVARRLRFQITESDGRESTRGRGHWGFYAKRGADVYESFERGSFSPGTYSVAHRDPDAVLVAILRDGEMFHRTLEVQDRGRVVKLVRGSGIPGIRVEFLTKPDAEPSRFSCAIAVLGDQYVVGQSLGTMHAMSPEHSLTYTRDDQLITVSGLRQRPDQIWFDGGAAGFAVVDFQRDNKARYRGQVPCVVDWDNVQRYSGGRFFLAQLQLKFTPTSKRWYTARMWDLRKTPSPAINAPDHVAHRVVIVHGQETQQRTVILER